MTPQLHDLTPELDADGDPWRHKLVLREAEGHETCVECQRPATMAHQRYAGIRMVESCRGLILCSSHGCRNRHLDRHRIALEEPESAPAKGSKAA